MSPAEVFWRVRCAGDDLCRVGLASVSSRWLERTPGHAPAVLDVAAEAVGPLPPPGFAADSIQAENPGTIRTIQRAQRLLDHRVTLFDLEDHPLGDSIDWNFEYKAGKTAPLVPACRIDYRDYAVTGDCKFVWELNRHHHWVVLGRAYRLSGELCYAAEVVRQLQSWLEACPFGRGMNWRSPLELGVRLINWVWAVELIRPAGLIDGPLAARLMTSVHQHLTEIARRYSRFSSANNHLVGEAAGVLVAAAYFHRVRGADRLFRQARMILAREMERQTFADGGNREQAFGYHLFVLELLLVAGLAARGTGRDFTVSYWRILEAMFDFAAALTEAGPAPAFGDKDDAYVLDLDDQPRTFEGLLPVGAALFGRADFKARSASFSSRALWLLGEPGRSAFERVNAAVENGELKSRALPASGFYLLQSGSIECGDAISVLFDCGELGFEAIAAHGHADALQFTLRINGEDVIVDPGTYDYFTFGDWRDYFRGTAAHNTLMVDGCDQSEMAGSFMWGRKANARCLRWEPRADGGLVAGEHDGYRRLSDPVIHRRQIELDGPSRRLVIRDVLESRGRHQAAFHLQLAAGCQARLHGEHEVRVARAGGELALELDSRLDLQLVCGQTSPIRGWVSPAYHRKSASSAIVGRCEFEGTLELETVISFGPRPSASSSSLITSAQPRRNEGRLIPT